VLVENVWEELDWDKEFFFNGTKAMLYLVWNATLPPTDIEAIRLPYLLNLTEGVANITIRALGFRDTALTYDARDYGAPSGGDWGLHRGAAITLESAGFGITIDACNFTRLDGNAVGIFGTARGVQVSNSDFSFLGESAIVSLGDTQGAPVSGLGPDGSAGTQPWGTVIVNNTARELGVFNKQSGFYFMAVSGGARVEGNVVFNGARSAVNINDCFGNGSVLSRNVFFSLNRETADHGPSAFFFRHFFSLASPPPPFTHSIAIPLCCSKLLG
jgi:hypothetical protein